MKKYIYWVGCLLIFFLAFLVSTDAYAVDQLVVAAPELNTPYEGDTQISGRIPAYGTLPSGETVPLNGVWSGAYITINGKAYTPNTSGQQMFDYIVTKIDDNWYSFTFTLPDATILKEGDSLLYFVISGSIDNPTDYPQLSQKMSNELIVSKRVELEVGGDIHVSYQDEQGNELREETLLQGNVGDPYTTSSEEIFGYTLKEIIGNQTGTFTNISQEVTYMYTKDPIKAADVTIHYLDQDGNELHSKQTISGNVGDLYDTSTEVFKLKIKGYTLDESKLPNNTTGTLSETGQIVTYTYSKNTTPTTPDNSDSSRASSENNNREKAKAATTATSQNKSISQKATKQKLPRTGEASFSFGSYLGALISLMAILCFKLNKHDTNY